VQDRIAEARELLESVVLLALVGSERQERLRRAVARLLEAGADRHELAAGLGIPPGALDALLRLPGDAAEPAGLPEELVSSVKARLGHDDHSSAHA
jgi:hypothetical protein